MGTQRSKMSIRSGRIPLSTLAVAFLSVSAYAAGDGSVRYAMEHPGEEVTLLGRKAESSTLPSGAGHGARHAWVIADAENSNAEVYSAEDPPLYTPLRVTGHMTERIGARHFRVFESSTVSTDTAAGTPQTSEPADKAAVPEATADSAGFQRYTPFLLGGIVLVVLAFVLVAVTKRKRSAPAQTKSERLRADAGDAFSARRNGQLASLYVPPMGFIVLGGGRETPGMQKRLYSQDSDYVFRIRGVHDTGDTPATVLPNIIPILCDYASTEQGEVVYDPRQMECRIVNHADRAQKRNPIRINGDAMTAGETRTLKNRDRVTIGTVELEYHESL